MGKTRICSKQCHDAKTPTCNCWCGGLFHGAAGQRARADFSRQFQTETLPTTLALFDVVTQPQLFDAVDNVPRVSWRHLQENHVGARKLEQIVRRRRHRRPKGE